MLSEIFRNIFRFVLLVSIQILLLNNIQFSGLINPFLYVAFIFLLPFQTPKHLVLLFSFALGLIIDVFSDTGGLHTFATVFIGFIRPFIIKKFAPQDGYPFGSKPNISSMGIEWFLPYVITLTFIHHFILFYMETLSFSSFFFTFFKVICSTFFTILLIQIHQLFSKKTKNIN